MMPDDRDAIEAVEAAFGPGAYELITELGSTADGAPEAPGPNQHQAALSVTDAADTSPSRRTSAVAPGGGAAELVPGQPALLLFELADTRFGVSLANVVEIQPVPQITRVLRGPNWLRGLANLRGTILSVIDLRIFLGRSALSCQRDSRLMVVRSLANAQLTGLLVDRVWGLGCASPDAIEQIAEAERPGERFLRGVVPCGGQPVTLLDLEALLLSSNRQQYQRV